MADDWTWTFLGFESGAEGHPVQAWYDALCVEDREMLLDTLVYLERQTNRRWPEKMYDPLDGAGGISEIRIPEFRGVRNGKLQRITLRIYGFFGPLGYQGTYTFLHGTDKKVKNDKPGKGIGKRRLDEICDGQATVHEFSF